MRSVKFYNIHTTTNKGNSFHHQKLKCLPCINNQQRAMELTANIITMNCNQTHSINVAIVSQTRHTASPFINGKNDTQGFQRLQNQSCPLPLTTIHCWHTVTTLEQ